MPQIAKFHYPIDASRYKVGSSKQSLLPCFHPLIKRICDERPECIIYSRLVDISGEIIENKPMLVAMLPENTSNCQIIIFYLFFNSNKRTVQLLCSQTSCSYSHCIIKHIVIFVSKGTNQCFK